MVGVSGASKDINVRRILHLCSMVQLLCRILAQQRQTYMKEVLASRLVGRLSCLFTFSTSTIDFASLCNRSGSYLHSLY
jgi:hypothetical protein